MKEILPVFYLSHHQVVFVLLVEAHRDRACSSTVVEQTLRTNNYQIEQRWYSMSIKGGTHYVQIQKGQQSYLTPRPCKANRDHRASTTANFRCTGRHYSHTLLTGVFNNRLIPSDIRRYPGSTVSVTFLALQDIFLTGRSSTRSSRDGLWSFSPNKLVNSMLVMLPRVSTDPV